MSIVVVEIFIVLALFFANGVFAMSEMAVVSSRKSRLSRMAASGDVGATAALRLAEAPNRFLPTVQIGITLIGLLAGAFSGATLASELAAKIGDIPSLEDRLRPEARQRPDGSWLVDGQYELAKLAALLGVAIAPPAGAASATLSAFVGDQLAGHPREGDCFTRAGLRFEIIDMDRTSVDKILIERALEALATETSATAE